MLDRVAAHRRERNYSCCRLHIESGKLYNVRPQQRSRSFSMATPVPPTEIQPHPIAGMDGSGDPRKTRRKRTTPASTSHQDYPEAVESTAVQGTESRRVCLSPHKPWGLLSKPRLLHPQERSVSVPEQEASRRKHFVDA